MVTDLLGWVRDLARHGALGLATALLPSPDRERIADREGLDAAVWSAAVGLIEGTVGLALYMAGFLVYVGRVGAAHQWLLIANWRPGLTSADLQYAGIFAFFGWHMRPEAWLWSAIALTGLLREVCFLATREPLAEPVVALLLFSWRALTSWRRARHRLDELGPLRRDRLIPDPPGEACDLMVVSCRDKPAWNPRVTIEVGDHYYRLLRVEDRWEGPRRVVCFLLREVADEEVVRGFVSHNRDPLAPEPARSD